MQFIPRKLVFKAWNKETRLMMRLNSIDCVKGELFREGHILLQFTGLYDQKNEEIYEMDLVLIGDRKFLVTWDNVQNGWGMVGFPDKDVTYPWKDIVSTTATRICNYFESENAAESRLRL